MIFLNISVALNLSVKIFAKIGSIDLTPPRKKNKFLSTSLKFLVEYASIILFIRVRLNLATVSGFAAAPVISAVDFFSTSLELISSWRPTEVSPVIFYSEIIPFDSNSRRGLFTK